MWSRDYPSIKGAVTALITPFCDGKVDEKGLVENIEYQIVNGINGILVLGTTGEASVLTEAEKELVITLAVDCVRGRVPVWVGTGTNCTEQTILHTRRAEELGADLALIAAPYYNKPTQEGIYRHFEAIALNTNLPIIVYNIPGRCAVDIELDTTLRIAALPHIIGLKDSSGELERAAHILHRVVSCYPHFSFFSGDDAFTLPLMALGAVGCVSVASNLVPAHIFKLVDRAARGDFVESRRLHFELLDLFSALFLETNPAPVKAAMNLVGKAAGECRLPLTPLSQENMRRLEELLAKTMTVSVAAD